MTSPATGPTRQAPSTSDHPRLDIFVFNCGHGDTIVIKLPNGEWALVDCYLPVQNGVRERFFDFLDDNDIKCIDYIFQTHPDIDHYHGMSCVIEHFINKGQKIKAYFDSGLNSTTIKHLLYNLPGRNEYRELQDKLRVWVKDKKLTKVYALFANHYPVTISGGFDCIHLIPLSPEASAHRYNVADDIKKMARNSGSRLSSNTFSLVLALSAKVSDKRFSVLLGADAEPAGLDNAIGCWNRYCDMEAAGQKTFNAVKVPHHGSKHSHCPQVCQMRPSAGTAIAAISAGERQGLPDSSVLKDYLSAGWKVVATTTRGSSRPRVSKALQLADRTKTQNNIQTHLVRLSWSAASGLSVIPLEAAITLADLKNY